MSSPKARAPVVFYVWVYVVMLALAGAFMLRAAPATARAWAFAAAVAVSYAFLYTVPALLAAVGFRWSTRRGRVWPEACVAVAMASLAQLVLAGDYVIHGMFGFHINGFVINLLMTPDGITSMGADASVLRVALAAAVVVFAFNALGWVFLTNGRAGGWLGGKLARWRWRPLFGLLVLVTLAERATYGMANLRAWPDVMAMAAATPGYQPTTFRRLAKKFGIEQQRQAKLDVPGDRATLQYPLHPPSERDPASRPNIVWLVCESLRADMLTPELMPRTWAFSQEARRFTRHYSGGNGTRMGVFSLFYGMPGSYWFKVLAARRSPVFMDRLQELGYEVRASTSAAFSYPEFDKTVFVNVPAGQLHAERTGQGWESDRHHVARIREWLRKGGGQERPFFLFHFFESSHARYFFPPESVVRRPYLEEFNYATADIGRDIGLIFNRYANSVHHLDSQLGAVLDGLREQGLLENSIILITGDHGEEFLENGNWGHNSTFSEQQVRVPLVLRVPGLAPGVVDYPTSHVDVAPTLMPLLGMDGPASDYATGTSLFSSEPRLITFADWDRIGMSDGEYKYVFPLRASAQVGGSVSTADDRAVADEGSVMREHGAVLARLLGLINRFVRKR